MLLNQRLTGILPGTRHDMLSNFLNSNPKSWPARLPIMMFLLLFLLTAYTHDSLAGTTTWEAVASSQITAKLTNPVRNRRSADASVDINLGNVSGKTLTGPFRLIITGLTPAAKVSIGNATGTTAAGEPYYNLTGYIGSSFASAGAGVVNVTVRGGGSTIFSFTTRVEQQVTQALTIKITSPATLLTVGSTPQTVKGTVSDPAAQVTLNGAPVTNSNGSFQAAVTLDEGHNTISARAVDALGEDVTDVISLSLDMTPPYLTVESPKDGDTVRTNKIAVSGLINDIVRGTVAEGQAQVTVNGKVASISNRSYLAEDIILNEGDNTLKIDGADNVGNTSSISIKVNYVPLAAQHIELLSGQDQSAKINTTLTEPLKVKLLDDKKQPVANKSVIFRVTQGDGIIGADTQDQGQGTLVQTDAKGVASTPFKLGTRAGTGNQRVRAASVGFDGEVLFYASATVGPGNKVTVNSGNNQRGAIDQPLPQPFVVAVVDAGANVVSGAQIEFKITQGSGKFQNGLTSITTATDSDGRATAELTLGSEEGLDVQRVTATLVGTELYAGFTASALKTGVAGQTSISGVVLDNQDKPLPKVTVRVDGTTREAQTDAQGQFKITEVPVGSVRLIADGTTTTAEGEWPTLAFNLVTIAGAENPLAAPVYLVKLDTVNAKQVGEQDVTLTLPDVPGFALEVKKGSVTFPDGKKTGLLSVTPVNASKIPMAPPNGMQPQFIVTIQPVGAKFDPPASLSLPNVDGHKPGAQVEMYSYDHDLEEFVSIGLGTVNAEGSVIKSNQGVGVIKAGWHCGSQPGGAGCANGCPVCKDCDGNCNCVAKAGDPRLPECQKCGASGPVPDLAKNDQCCGGGSSVCKTGSCTPVKLDTVEAKVNGKDEDVVAFKTGGTSINFTGTATGSNCDYEYKWDFGDSENSTEQSPEHTFKKEGNYDVSLKVKCKKCSTAEKSDTLKVSVVKVDLKEVSFAGTQYHQIVKDDDSGDYSAPHWQDNSSPLNGNGDDPNDRKYPVAFTRNSEMSVSAKFELKPVPTAKISKVTVKGDGPGSIDIPEVDGSLSGSNITIPDTKAAEKFENTTKFFPNFNISWSVSFDEGNTWVESGASDNPIYVLLGEPKTTVIYTLVDIGVRNADGYDGSDDSVLMDKIFSEFSDLKVTRASIPNDPPMGYWTQNCTINYVKGTDCWSTKSLLKNGYGRCGAWANLLVDTMAVQGVDKARVRAIYPKNIGNDYSNGHFLVKNWVFDATNQSLNDLPGVAAQGNFDPQSLFGDHAVVVLGGTNGSDKVYDPSYGKSFSNHKDWEDQSIDGLTYVKTSTQSLVFIPNTLGDEQTEMVNPNGILGVVSEFVANLINSIVKLFQ